MHSDIPQRKALKFLREHLHSQAPFTKSELADATGLEEARNLQRPTGRNSSSRS